MIGKRMPDDAINFLKEICDYGGMIFSNEDKFGHSTKD
jgi:hypothetical protein